MKQPVNNLAKIMGFTTAEFQSSVQFTYYRAVYNTSASRQVSAGKIIARFFMRLDRIVGDDLGKVDGKHVCPCSSYGTY